MKKASMVYNRKTSAEERALIRFLYMERRYSLREIAAKVDRSAATVMRVLKEFNTPSTYSQTHGKVTHQRRRRPRKLSSREERLLIRALLKLRRTEGNFTAKRLMNEANISESDVSVRTVGRFLNSKGYFYLQARKKGLLTNNDKSLRVAFAKKVREEYDTELWTHKIAFYLDGVAFRTRPTRLIKHELLLEGSIAKNLKVSTNFAPRKGVKLDLEGR